MQDKTNTAQILDEDVAAAEAAAKAAEKVKGTGKVATPKVKDETPEVIIFGSGEYRLTNKNIKRHTQHLNEFNANHDTWKWAMSDVLGIKRDGTVGKRYHDILLVLSDSDPDQKELKDAMAEVEADETAEKK